MKIKADEVAGDKTILHSLLLASLKKEHFDTIKENEIEITMQIDGIDLSPVEFFEAFEANYNAVVFKAAKKILAERFQETFDVVDALQKVMSRELDRM